MELKEVSIFIRNLLRGKLEDKDDKNRSLKWAWSAGLKKECSIFSLYQIVKNSIIKKYEKVNINKIIIISRIFKVVGEFKL